VELFILLLFLLENQDGHFESLRDGQKEKSPDVVQTHFDVCTKTGHPIK